MARACHPGGPPAGHVVRGAPSTDTTGEHMLVTCVAYQNGRRLADIPVSDIRSYTSRPDCFVWVGLKDPEPGELAALQAEFDLHPLAVEDASHGHQRPKIEEYGQSLFVVLHIIEMCGGELVSGEVSIFAGPKYIISARRGTKLGFGDVRRRSEEQPELLQHGPAFVLYALMDAVVDRYFPVMEALSGEIENLEERIFAGHTTRIQVEALYGMKCKLMTLDHAAGSLLEALTKLHGGRVPTICTGLQDYFRDVYDHLLRLDHTVENLRDMVTTAISVNLSLIALQESENTKRLAAYAALAAVPTMIAGIYGMNFTHMPELQWPLGYPFALLTMIVIDGWLVYRFRRTGWL
jgi:magnesium transporter